jgi:hypothetical protein
MYVCARCVPNYLAKFLHLSVSISIARCNRTQVVFNLLQLSCSVAANLYFFITDTFFWLGQMSVLPLRTVAAMLGVSGAPAVNSMNVSVTQASAEKVLFV